MENLSQKDSRWRDDKLGTCNDTIGKSGCYITCLAMLSGKYPNEVNDLLRDKGGYVNGCLVDEQKSADILGLEYNGRSSEPDGICIMCTDAFAPKNPTHFVVWLGNNRIIDPLYGQERNNDYHIVNFRLFKSKGDNMDKIDVARAIAITRLGNPFQNEVDYIIREFIDKNRPLEEYARNNAVRDSLIPNNWLSTTGNDCPKNEIDFWDIFFREHPDFEEKGLSLQWYNDHVKDKLDALNKQISGLNEQVKHLTEEKELEKNRADKLQKELGENLTKLTKLQSDLDDNNKLVNLLKVENAKLKKNTCSFIIEIIKNFFKKR